MAVILPYGTFLNIEIDNSKMCSFSYLNGEKKYQGENDMASILWIDGVAYGYVAELLLMCRGSKSYLKSFKLAPLAGETLLTVLRV